MEGLAWLAILAGAAGVAVAPAFPLVRRLLGLSEDTPEAQAVRNFLRLRRKADAQDAIVEAVDRNSRSDEQRRRFAYPQQLPSTAGPSDGLATSLDFLERDQHLFLGLGDMWGAGNVLNLIGFIRERHGEFDQALEMHRAALALFEEDSDPEGIGDSHNNLGVVFGRMGKVREALSYHSAALEVRRRLGDPVRISNSHNNLAVVLAGEKTKDARGRLEEAAQLSVASTEDDRGMGKIINNTTVLEIESGCAEDQAELLCERFHRALALRNASEDQRGNAKTRNNLGIVHALQGDYEAANEHFGDAAALAGSVEDNVGLLHILRNWRRLIETMTGQPERLAELKERIADVERSEIFEDVALKTDCEAFVIKCGGGYIAPGQVALFSSGSATPASAAELEERLRQGEAAT